MRTQRDSVKSALRLDQDSFAIRCKCFVVEVTAELNDGSEIYDFCGREEV